jgi:two-component system response regulator CpxR
MNHLLLADDDPLLCFMLKRYLEGEGFQVESVQDGKLALQKALTQDFDLIALDVTMPGMNGFDVLRALRTYKTTPVLILTARGEDRDSILGFELGADDYLAKPCDPRVLEAHIRAVLRRSVVSSDLPEANAHCTTVGELTLNSVTRGVSLNGQPVTLTKTEYNILSLLVQKAGQVLVRSELSELALGRPLGRYDRSLDIHISNLRRKLGPLADGRDRISAIRGVGYRYLTY